MPSLKYITRTPDESIDASNKRERIYEVNSELFIFEWIQGEKCGIDRLITDNRQILSN